ncbi:protein NEOXANTHIN-DEFICIENT 1 isoform X1 [Dioscorea cayenensis subsp. rotundata]|uniref:Protein NEOXANTHIN-DEFICIENT 1 isoform X1 n=1 Tax=Dioscorea cayennensis subsp. rotundata TaxID=55577 RepID=A0AB40BTG7_DIOCR|nr:protein NEOXANTHIN-DEFICIENT 1 isoform X1 [Dioscorea cayenensis subsp. rotundata]XP_039130711.1 protein NEOXANTHIN-DEFICIENT 1 isoform X1 [Dioscorea cayenensis subsp. rotundata]
MDVADKPSSGYALGPPWSFKGRALYQLHLVRAETARPFIPKEFKLVQFFGYTLGGFFLAHYDESPAGMFDELVVIAGIVWNPPTSCAWAARVLVNSHDACSHGQKEIGLPSRVAMFSKQRARMMTETAKNKHNGFLDIFGLAAALPTLREHCEIRVSEINDSSLTQLCSISMPAVVPKSKPSGVWMGPVIRMSLPSFSGQTLHNPHLLKYSCQIQCRVRAVEAAKVSGPPKRGANEDSDDVNINTDNLSMKKHEEDETWRRSISVLLSKPILALEFNLLKMQVEAPTVVVPSSRKNE